MHRALMKQHQSITYDGAKGLHPTIVEVYKQQEMHELSIWQWWNVRCMAMLCLPSKVCSLDHVGVCAS